MACTGLTLQGFQCIQLYIIFIRYIMVSMFWGFYCIRAISTPTVLSQQSPSVLSQPPPTVLSQPPPTVLSQQTPTLLSQQSPYRIYRIFSTTPTILSQQTPTVLSQQHLPYYLNKLLPYYLNKLLPYYLSKTYCIISTTPAILSQELSKTYRIKYCRKKKGILSHFSLNWGWPKNFLQLFNCVSFAPMC